jgi:hypothetical protein
MILRKSKKGVKSSNRQNHHKTSHLVDFCELGRSRNRMEGIVEEGFLLESILKRGTPARPETRLFIDFHGMSRYIKHLNTK